VSFDAVRNVMRLSQTRLSSRLTLLILAERADKDGFCWPSIGQLAEDTRLDRASIFRALDEAEGLGELLVLRTEGRASRYIVCVGLSPDEIAEAIRLRNLLGEGWTPREVSLRHLKEWGAGESGAKLRKACRFPEPVATCDPSHPSQLATTPVAGCDPHPSQLATPPVATCDPEVKLNNQREPSLKRERGARTREALDQHPILASAWPELLEAFSAIPTARPPANGAVAAWQANLAALVEQDGHDAADVRDALMWAMTSRHDDADWLRGMGLQFNLLRRAGRSGQTRFETVAWQFARATARKPSAGRAMPCAAAYAAPQSPNVPTAELHGVPGGLPAVEAWTAAKGVIAGDMDGDEFTAWVLPIGAERAADGGLVLTVASDFYHRWVSRKYWPRFVELLASSCAEACQVRLEVRRGEDG
jgi:hypothetical protein